MTPRETAQERLRIVQAVDAERERGISQTTAAIKLGAHAANISRWRMAYARGGIAALEPKIKIATRDAASADSCARAEKALGDAAKFIRAAKPLHHSRLKKAIQRFIKNLPEDLRS